MTQSEKLAQSLEQLRELQKKRTIAIRSRDLTRTYPVNNPTFPATDLCCRNLPLRTIQNLFC